jgi:hypothetical protein
MKRRRKVQQAGSGMGPQNHEKITKPAFQWTIRQQSLLYLVMIAHIHRVSGGETLNKHELTIYIQYMA